jgi:4-hydroxy-tetrahydrodipicolinate synthase
VPELFVALYEAWTEGDVERARGLQSSIARIAELLGRGNNHAAFKFAAARRGLPVGTTVREPLAPLDADGERGAEAALEVFERSGVGARQRD